MAVYVFINLKWTVSFIQAAKGHLISEQIRIPTLIFQNCNENIAMISALVYKNFQGRNSSNIFVAILEN